MELDLAAVLISILSLVVALFALRISIQRYELQGEQLNLQKMEFEEKYKTQLHIRDEQFLTSHTIGPQDPKYYSDHPNEIEFEYRAKYQNSGHSVINIESLIVSAVPFDNEEVWWGCGDRVLINTHVAPNEEIEISHRLNKENLDRFLSQLNGYLMENGVIEFSVSAIFSDLSENKKEHKRTLYRLVKGGGDRSKQGYNPGEGINKHSFVYEITHNNTL